jgi:hypothetical protein
VADRGGVSLENVGAIFSLTRERIRQMELHALRRFKRNAFVLFDITAAEIVAALRELARAHDRVSSATDHTTPDAHAAHAASNKRQRKASRASVSVRGST